MSNVNINGNLIRDAVRQCTGIINMLSVTHDSMLRSYKNAKHDWTFPHQVHTVKQRYLSNTH